MATSSTFQMVLPHQRVRPNQNQHQGPGSTSNHHLQNSRSGAEKDSEMKSSLVASRTKKSTSSKAGKSSKSKGKDRIVDLGVWLVEKVVKKRVRRGRLEYFVKWKDFPSSANTWEPVEHLDSCPQLIAAYEAQKGKRNNKRKSVLPSTSTAASSASWSNTASGSDSGSGPESSGISSQSPAPTTVTVPAPVPGPVLSHAQRPIPETTRVTINFNWDEHPVKAVIGIDRVKATGELFYYISWDRHYLKDNDADNTGNLVGTVTEVDLVPASIVRQKVPALVIAYLSSIISWIPSTPVTSPDSSLSGESTPTPEDTATNFENQSGSEILNNESSGINDDNQANLQIQAQTAPIAIPDPVPAPLPALPLMDAEQIDFGGIPDVDIDAYNNNNTTNNSFMDFYTENEVVTIT